jgi:hypothetical protein
MSNIGIKYLLKELSTKFGIIDFKQPVQAAYLFNLMQGLNIPTHLIQETITRLVEAEKFYARNPKGKKISVFDTEDARDAAINKGYEKVDREEAEKELAKQTKSTISKQKNTDTGTEPTGAPPPDAPKITNIPDNPMDKGAGKAEVEEKSVTKKISQNRASIFDDKVTGKGGGETSLQEEIAGISRGIAIQQPNLTPEEHKQKITQFIKDNYGHTKYGNKDLTTLINKSVSGPSTMSKIKSNKNMKFNDNQPEGYPIQVTFTDGGTNSVRDELKNRLEEAEKNNDMESISHYKTELEYFIKHATKETGVEGDGDTGMMYVDTDGRMRMIYISNKQGLKDPHANATVKSASEAIKASIEPGANEGALISRLDEAVKGGIDANGDMVKSFRAEIDMNLEELNKAPLTTIATGALTGQAEFVDKTSEKYLKEAAKNAQVKDYIEKNKLDKDDPEHIVQAAIAIAGSGKADGLNDSVKQAPNKLVYKMATATSSIRQKVQREIDKGKTPEEAANIVANKKNNKGKPLMGGNISPEDCLSIYNNKALEKLEQNVQTRKDAMQQSHENMYNTLVELDVAYYQDETRLSSDDALEKYNNEAGPNERTYTKSFMKRMHWDRYISGVDDDKKMIEIGDKAYSPKDFSNCLATLSEHVKKNEGESDEDYVKRVDEHYKDPANREALQIHLEKNMRITSGTMKLSFVSKGKTIELGDDTWRTAGDLSKIAGGLGTGMQKCLGEK